MMNKKKSVVHAADININFAIGRIPKGERRNCQLMNVARLLFKRIFIEPASERASTELVYHF